MVLQQWYCIVRPLTNLPTGIPPTRPELLHISIQVLGRLATGTRLCMSAVQGRRSSLRCKRPRPIEMPVAMHYPCLTEPTFNEPVHHQQANIVQFRSSKWRSTSFQASDQPSRAPFAPGITAVYTQHGQKFHQLLGLVHQACTRLCLQQLYKVPHLVLGCSQNHAYIWSTVGMGWQAAFLWGAHKCLSRW